MYDWRKSLKVPNIFVITFYAEACFGSGWQGRGGGFILVHKATVKYLVGGSGPGDAHPAVKFAQCGELGLLSFKPVVSVWMFKHLGAAEWLSPSQQEHGGIVCGITFLVGLVQEYGVSVALG